MPPRGLAFVRVHSTAPDGAPARDRPPPRLKPAVHSVPPADTVFHVIGAAPRHRIRPELPGSFPVLRVQHVQPAPAEQLALRDACVLPPLSAEVVARAIRRRGP